MRNYWVSISIHIVFLLLLLFPFLTNSSDQLELDQIVWVDFSSQNQITNRTRTKEVSRKPATKPVEVKKPAQPEKKAPSSSPSKEKKQIEGVQSNTSEDISVLQQEKIKEEAERKAAAKKQKELEEERARKEEAKQAKIASFTKLFDDAEVATEDHSSVSTNNENYKPASGLRSNVSGSLGNRVVLKKPTIIDDSQKYGRVVVKICVAASGKVLSSEYTQIGSTTSDPYLIGLAEKGAMGYLFSKSKNSKECGKVVIDFELK